MGAPCPKFQNRTFGATAFANVACLPARSPISLPSRIAGCPRRKDGTSHVGKNSRRFHDSRTAPEDLADAVVSGDLSCGLVDSASHCRQRQDGGVLRCAGRRRLGNDAQAGRDVQRYHARPGDDFRIGHHALHFGLDYLSASLQRLAAARRVEERRRKRPEENQRIHPLRHGHLMPGAKLVLCEISGDQRLRAARVPHRRRAVAGAGTSSPS